MIVKSEEKDVHAFRDYFFNQASPGERNLFYISIFLASLSAYRKNENLTIILDEPELHLHLDKVIEFVTTIEKELPNATLWVATHSIHLIPIFEFDETIYVKDGKIQKRGGQTGGFYADIYNSIIGTTEDLIDFLQDITGWEMYRFFEQCLFYTPQSVITGNNDPQTNIIFTKINDRLKKGETLKILDYGVGKGRFGVILDKLLNQNNNYFLEYFTYDLDDENYNLYIKDKIKCHVRHYTSDDDLSDNKFDYILLVNVLHEISPVKWASEFFHHNATS